MKRKELSRAWDDSFQDGPGRGRAMAVSGKERNKMKTRALRELADDLLLEEELELEEEYAEYGAYEEEAVS